jgi:hypothetical protein
MLDVLSRCDAASSTGRDRGYPSLYLIVTSDTLISVDVLKEATRLQVLVWESAVDLGANNRVQVTPPTCLNCAEVFQQGQVPSTLFGPWFDLGTLKASSPGGLDEPMLDDSLVGYPGTPGKTGPNP